jgi:Flp pilus assembly protein TadG
MAFILPVMLLIVLGSIEIGRAFVFGVAVQDAAREATRLAANARVDPSVTDTGIVQRVLDSAAPAMLGCAPVTSVASTPVSFSCGGGSWTVTTKVTPTGSASSYSSLSSIPSSSLGQLNGARVEVKVAGSVSLLAGLATGWSGLSLYQIGVQGDAVMVMM